MSGGERERSHVVRLVIAKRLSQRAASERLGICVRQVKRLVRAYRWQGDAGLVSKQRGGFRCGGSGRASVKGSKGFCAASTPALARPWPPKSSPRSRGSRSRVRAYGGFRSLLAFGSRSRARRGGRSCCASGGQGSASSFRSTAASTTGSRAGRRAAP